MLGPLRRDVIPSEGVCADEDLSYGERIAGRAVEKRSLGCARDDNLKLGTQPQMDAEGPS
jgi:hypothetical protein